MFRAKRKPNSTLRVMSCCASLFFYCPTINHHGCYTSCPITRTGEYDGDLTPRTLQILFQLPHSTPFVPRTPWTCLANRRGECQKPGCFCGKAKAGRSKQLGFKMCECGHPFDIHRLLVGAAAPTGRALRRGKVIREKKVRS